MDVEGDMIRFDDGHRTAGGGCHRTHHRTGILLLQTRTWRRIFYCEYEEEEEKFSTKYLISTSFLLEEMEVGVG